MNRAQSAPIIHSRFRHFTNQSAPINPGIVGLLAIICLLTIASFTPQAFAQGNPDEGWTRVDKSLALNLSQINACYQSELVNMTGVLSGTIRTKVQPDGTISVKESLSLAATGTGSISGADYTLSDSAVDRYDGIGSFPLTVVVNRVSKLVGSGVPDLYLHFKYRISFDADGNVTHGIEYVSSSCNP